MTYIFYIALGLMTIGILFSAIRLIKGPTAGDRVVGLDTITIIAVAGLVLMSHFYERFIYMDVALVYGVLGFIGVIVIARYLEDAL